MKSSLNPIIVLLVSFLLINSSFSQIPDLEELYNVDYFGNITAPDFPKEAEWLNTESPVSLNDLKGKIVLLDFWTYCCINCIHIIPDLKKLEEKYKDVLVVIGVHSAKFLTERGTENIRQAILRYEVGHPVINDKDFEVWQNYDAHAWPTLVLIDPRGKIIGKTSGEGVFDVYDPFIENAIKHYDMSGAVLKRGPLKFSPEKDKEARSLLSYPGKIAADPEGARLFITDSNNNRVLILKINERGDEATVEEVIGTGKPGRKDGNYIEAEFYRPQGICFYNGRLYVADTENHLIREIDLSAKRVATVAGLGFQSSDRGFRQGNALETSLNSPWDLVAFDDAVYIAMAGSHQVWKYEPGTGTIWVYAGNGKENIIDGDFLSCSLAQPSGITTGGIKLFIADSEVSAVRSADIGVNGNVRTIVGTGLFDFGDVDGKRKEVRLQHPLGITFDPSGGNLYIADTYNNKIKVIDPVTGECHTYSGTGISGNRDGNTDAQFNEPGGLTVKNRKIFVTDTNNNLIRVIDMDTKEVRTLMILNPGKLTAPLMSNTEKKSMKTIQLEPAELNEGSSFIHFELSLPEGFKINPDAKPQVAISSEGNVLTPFELEVNTLSPFFEVPVNFVNGDGKVSIELLVYYCDVKNAGICKFKDLYFEVAVKVSPAGRKRLLIEYTLN